MLAGPTALIDLDWTFLDRLGLTLRADVVTVDVLSIPFPLSRDLSAAVKGSAFSWGN